MLCISWAALMEKAVLSLFSFRLQAQPSHDLWHSGLMAGMQLLPKAVAGLARLLGRRNNRFEEIEGQGRRY
jgi:hypothetical protein